MFKLSSRPIIILKKNLKNENLKEFVFEKLEKTY